MRGSGLRALAPTVAVVLTAAGLLIVRLRPSPVNRSYEMVLDCRKQLLDAVPDEVRPQWNPGTNRIAIQPNGDWFTTAEFRARDPQGRIIAVTANCVYAVSPDTTFVRRHTRFEQAVLTPEHDVETEG
ncbi:MAG: hypothetical protein WEF86_06020 [Gemmatimonadota bacterium]